MYADNLENREWMRGPAGGNYDESYTAEFWKLCTGQDGN